MGCFQFVCRPDLAHGPDLVLGAVGRGGCGRAPSSHTEAGRQQPGPESAAMMKGAWPGPATMGEGV